MNQENQQQQVTQSMEDIVTFQQQQYDELMANSVSLEKYNELANSYKELFKARSVATETAAKPVEKKSGLELTKEFLDAKKARNRTDLETCQLLLDIRAAELEEHGVDIFVSQGHHTHPTQQSFEMAQRTADIYQECLDTADGNSEVFKTEMIRRMPETPLMNKNISKRR